MRMPNSVRITVRIPPDTLAQLDRHCYDPPRRQLKYGMRSQLITRLLQQYLSEHSSPARSSS